MKNFGLIIPNIETKEEGVEHILGSSKLKGEVINPSGDWTAYLPDKEPQSKSGLETNGCTVWSILNAIETLIFFKTKTRVNYADRYVALYAKNKGILDPSVGADPHKIAELIRLTCGLLKEGRLPFSDVVSKEEFYSEPVNWVELIKEGSEWYNEWDFSHEWVFRGGTPQEKRVKLEEALTKGTVCVSVVAWMFNSLKDWYEKPAGSVDGHFTMLPAAPKNNYVVFDSYDGFIKYLDPFFDFSIAKVFYLNPSKPKLDWIQSVINWIKSYLPFLKKQVDAVAPINFELPPPVIVNEWDTPEKAKHSARVIMDTFGLLWSEKDLLCAVIQAESGFNTKAVNQQTKDYGICQINSFYWIGEGKYFASIEEVLNKPEKSVKFMVEQYKAGHLDYWVAYKNLSYKRYL